MKDIIKKIVDGPQNQNRVEIEDSAKKLSLNEYQERASSTAIYGDKDKELVALGNNLIGLMYAGLGIAGEAGEVADEIKKIYRAGEGITLEKREKLKLELGDTLWYVAAISKELGYTLQEIAESNVKKLEERYGS